MGNLRKSTGNNSGNNAGNKVTFYKASKKVILGIPHMGVPHNKRCGRAVRGHLGYIPGYIPLVTYLGYIAMKVANLCVCRGKGL